MQVDAKKKVVVDYEGWRCVSDCVNFNESGTVLLLANCGYEEEVSCGRGEDGKEGRELMDSCMFTDSRFLLSLSLPCSLYYDEYGFA